MKRIKVKAHGIRAHVAPNVTVYTLKEGCLRFGKGKALAVKNSFFDIMTTIEPADSFFHKACVKITVRRVKREKIAEETV